MQGRRVFDRFGFNLPKTSSNKVEFTFLEEYAKMVYNTNLHDWQDNSGNLLTGYHPDSDLLKKHRPQYNEGERATRKAIEYVLKVLQNPHSFAN